MFRVFVGGLFAVLICQQVIALEGWKIVPPVTGYTKNDYEAERQNWNIAQDSYGIMYFANNAGLLQFDGRNWRLFRMPDQVGLRSVAVDENGRIYTGSYEEFGYWETKPDGTLEYHSLSAELKNYVFNNDEIWRILILHGKVYFQSFGTYFVYDGKHVIPHSSPEAILFFLSAGDKVITQGMQSGLFQLTDDTLRLIPGSQILRNALIRAAIRLSSDSILLGTASKGIFLYEIREDRFSPWKTEADALLTRGQINCGMMNADSLICFGTIGKGLIALNRKGKLLWHILKSADFPTNTVLFLYSDLENNIWAALDQGIALVNTHSPFRYIYSDSQNIELVYTAAVYDHCLYAGTNQGVFRLSPGSDKFTMIPGIQGQVWQLLNIDNQLLCGQNEGTFRIEGDRAIPVCNLTGGTSLQKISSKGREYLIQSTYGALAIYKKNTSGKWEFSHTVNGFNHPVRTLEVDHLGNIWASHFIKGLYRIRLNPDLTRVISVRSFGKHDGLPSDYKINVSKLGGRVVFCTGERFYTYDDLNEKIVPYMWLNQMTGEFSSAYRIIAAGADRYWLVNKNKFALVKTDHDSIEILDILPFSLLKNNLIDENEYIATLDENQYLFCLEDGLALFQETSRKRSGEFRPRILIRQVKVSSNRSSLLLPIQESSGKRSPIPYRYRTIRFTFAYPEYSGREIILHCRLKGSREILADSISKQLITYAYLEPGQYELNVKAVDEKNNQLGSVHYSFYMRPPFYASIFAYILYACIILLIAYFSWKGIVRHVERQNEKVRLEQAKLQMERIERREQKITVLKNEKLEAELRHKSKELASSTMAIIRKNEMLLQLRKEVENQKLKLGSQFPNKYADHLIKMINENISSDDDWNMFQQNFDLIHENFFRHLKTMHPDMTPHDMKLCAFIRLNLSTKEIASLLNITVRGVEAARYRLRKKFGIPAEKNLTEFLIEMKQEE